MAPETGTLGILLEDSIVFNKETSCFFSAAVFRQMQRHPDEGFNTLYYSAVDLCSSRFP
jgi:hypothetical protein